ncbi:Pentatricopeptide repeat [Ostreococcus tauri]|uniref:Pentatricopeptide repeat n=1 Tax=Ostreococcus tauri TaxID=70448 RepID=A0A090M5Z9_OSTTA|nr:Pentatricopeptide repeat [Ostreococcus tauri]CEF98097.1 Pentatricopeptide repeat [Ostreococcus tauri]|eukprot:XP_022839078.1 Pentatricopeptide repeat [Ostreococcus tauri]
MPLVSLSVATSLGTSLIVEIDPELGVAGAKRAIEDAHVTAHSGARVDVGALHGYGAFAGGVGLWYPVDDAALRRGRFECVMAQVRARDGGGSSEDDDGFGAMVTPEALRARNKAALASSPLVSPTAATTAVQPMAVGRSPLGFIGTPVDLGRRLSASEHATVAAATEAETERGKCEDLDTAYRLLMKLDGPEECGAGAPAYSALMLGYARQGRLIEALGLLEQWERGRGPKDAKFGVGKRGNIILRGSWRWSKEDVPKFPKRDEMGTRWYPRRAATTRMLFAALDACATCGDVRRTRRFMKRIMKWEGRVQNATNFNEDEYLWNALIKATARGKDPLSCLNVLTEMNKAGVLPTKVTYNIIISACAKGGRPDWCRALLQKMYILKDKNCRPDAVSYTTTLVAETAAAQGVVDAGAEFAGGVEVVKSLWNNFIKKNVKQDGVVIGAFVNAFVANSDIENALHALDHGYAANMYISPSVYFTAMRFLASKGDEDGVKRLGNKLRAKNASGEIAAEIDMFEAEACAAAGNVEGARAAIFRVQNGNEAAAAKVFRDRSSGVLVALFVQEVLECDVGENVSERAQATESFDEDDEEEYDDLTMLDSETILNHNGSLCRWEKPDVWSVTQALDLLDGAWSYDEFDEQGIGESPAPPPRGGWAQAVQSHAVEPLLFKNGVSPSEPIETVVPEIALCMRRGDIVRRSDSVSDAIQSLGANFNAVVIDDDTGIPVGTFRRADADVGPGITVGQVMSAGPERLFRDDTTVADVAMLCVRDSAALVAIVDEEGRIVGTLRQDDILIPAREESASPR